MEAVILQIFTLKFFFLNVKKYGEECVEWGVEKEASSWWIQRVWKYFSNVEGKLQDQGSVINKSFSKMNTRAVLAHQLHPQERQLLEECVFTESSVR